MKDLTLSGGTIAKYRHNDGFDRPVYSLTLPSGNEINVCCINLDGSDLHTMTPAGEPSMPLRAEYQVARPEPS